MPDPIAPPPAGDTPPVFDPVAFKTEFKTEITALLNTTVNNAIKHATTELTKKLTPPPKEDPPPTDLPVDPPPVDPKLPKDTPAANAELQSLRKTVAGLEKKANDAEKRVETETKLRLENERITSIKGILNDITFKDQASRELFFKAVERDIKRDDSGDLVADNAGVILPAKDYLNTLAEQHGNLLAPVGKSGAGAGPGTRGPGNQKWKMADLTPEKINALKPEERADLLRMAAAGEITY